MQASHDNWTQPRSVIKQIVEPFPAFVLGVGLSGDTARAFEHVAHLEKTAEVALLLVDDVGLHRFLALKASLR